MEVYAQVVVCDGKYFPEKMRENCPIIRNFLNGGGDAKSFSVINLAINFSVLRKCAFSCTSPCKLGQELPCLENLGANGRIP
jgi:hypothetical protein